jgi:hypothetical protein
VWEETRGKRSGFGQLMKWSFILFNCWLAFELFMLFARAGKVRTAYRDNGLAQLGIDAVVNVRLNELLLIWAVGFGILGAAALATRGTKRMVRKTVEAPPEDDYYYRPSAEAQRMLD